jgi:hypothetical protein
MNKIAYVIGFRWDNGEIAAYTVHNQTVFNGTIEEAKEVLDYVKRTSDHKDRKYEIYRLV